MNTWQLVYVLAGLGAILGIVGAISLDLHRLASWMRDGYHGQAPRVMRLRWSATGLAVLVALWLTAAVLR